MALLLAGSYCHHGWSAPVLCAVILQTLDDVDRHGTSFGDRTGAWCGPPIITDFSRDTTQSRRRTWRCCWPVRTATTGGPHQSSVRSFCKRLMTSIVMGLRSVTAQGPGADHLSSRILPVIQRNPVGAHGAAVRQLVFPP